MSLLDKNSKKALVESMRHALISSVKSNKALTESVQMESVKFVKEDATYEQLLNMTMNPIRESKYLPDFVMEGAVAIVSEALQSGRKVIGINALTEGAIKLVKKTDCVVTEAMLDAAEGIATSRGLNVVAEAIMVMEDAISKAEEKLGRKLTPTELEKFIGSNIRKNQITKAISDRDNKMKNGLAAKMKRSKDIPKQLKELAKKLRATESGSESVKISNEMGALRKELKGLNEEIGKLKESEGVRSKARRATQAANKARRRVTGAQQPVAKKASKLSKLVPKTKGGKIAAGAGIAAGTLIGLAAAKKWHDKKQAQKMAASKTK